MRRPVENVSRTVLAFAFTLITLAIAAPALADDAAGKKQEKIDGQGRIERSAPVTPYRFDGQASDLPAPKAWRPGDPVREIPRRAYAKPGDKKDPVGQLIEEIDQLHQKQQQYPTAESTRAFGTADRNFDGQGFTGVNPPDTVGDVGPSHYVQAINGSGGSVVVVYDKVQPNPNQLAAFALDSLGSGACANGAGDPIVLYDRFADRWLLTEFGPTSGVELCVYVSQTPDPTGSYFAYVFTTQQFPDYPKYGIWPTDANGGLGSYIVTTNEASSGVYALDRAAILAGAPATSQRFSIADLPGFSFHSVTPADLDGREMPPAGTPAIIMRQRDTEVHSGPAAPEDVIEMWHFDVDWTTPANTVFTQLPDLDVAEFSSDLCGLTSFSCFQQPGGGSQLDPLREVIMNRLQYQNFNDYEVLVGNFVTDVDGTDRGGLRWFEARRVGGAASPWTLHQEGTYSPDSDSRWMAASAMDQSGNIAIAYNISSTTTFPGLRYTGRMADDPLGVMTQGENVIIEGTASNSSNRYGDYASMNLDPADDCTFWFTGEYNPSSNWSTRIASFRFDACGCDLFPLPLSISGGVGGPNQVDLSWTDSELDTVVEYRVLRSRTMGGPYAQVGVVADSSMGVGSSGSYNFSDTTVSGDIDYFYVVRASDGGACSSENSNELAVTATGACTLPPLFDGLLTVVTPNSGICTLNLNWDAATPQCAGPISYEIYRAEGAPADPIPGNLLGTTSGTSFSDADQLATALTYNYLVRAIDSSNGQSDSNTVEVAGVPAGLIQPPVFTDDGGDTGVAQLVASGPWSNQPTGGNNGPGVYTTGDYGDNTCSDIVTPAMTLGVGDQLTFWSTYDIESGWDKGEVQISADGGSSWTRVEVGYPTNSTRTSDSCGLPTGDYFTGTDSNWNQYVGDLSPWNNQTVEIRWLMSTDGSQTRTIGWVIDDIVVGNGAAACATASACADNPIVDVTPDGPVDVCPTDIPLLTANLSGGVGPFSYQWYQDGQPIAAAVGSSYQPVDVGQHSYNVRVQAATCPDEVGDGQPTVLQVESAPLFSGIVSATNRSEATCGVDLSWNAASSVCPGPISYDVYRSDNAGVTVSPGNLIQSGLTSTSLTDLTNLNSGDDYFYLVRATEMSSGQSDSNSVEAVSVPTGPDAVSFSDDAGDTGAAALTPTAPWSVNASGGNFGPAVYATGDYGDNTCSALTSTPIQLGVADTLSFYSNFDIESGYDKGEVQISDDAGVSWTRVEVDYPNSATQTTDACNLGAGDYFTGSAPTWVEYSGDLSPWANQLVELRFEMSTDGSVTRTLGWTLDDIQISSPSSCSPAALGPAPAPDGSLGTSPLLAENLSDGVGDTLQVSWDASCSAADYQLLFGDLSNVASHVVGGSECSIGTSGSLTWNSVPAGNLFFLIVGTDGAGTESSWGRTSSGAERNGSNASGECAVTTKSTTATCP